MSTVDRLKSFFHSPDSVPATTSDQSIHDGNLEFTANNQLDTKSHNPSENSGNSSVLPETNTDRDASDPNDMVAGITVFLVRN